MAQPSRSCRMNNMHWKLSFKERHAGYFTPCCHCLYKVTEKIMTVKCFKIAGDA